MKQIMNNSKNTQIAQTDTQTQVYDVVICGGGFAGQTLARQLKLNLPDISIVVLERNKFPVSIATHKVGESTIESSAFYLAETLALQDYLQTNHLPKFGFRYFWQNNNNNNNDNNFTTRSELGLSYFYSYRSYQLDRGLFENDLQAMNRSMGVHVLDNVLVQGIEIIQDSSHTILYKSLTHKIQHQIKGRWVIDATGRRSLLQKKLKLRLKSEVPHSSVWFRVKGRFDIDDFVPETETTWHQRVTQPRYYSTNHFMGLGYWIWVIPLASGHTSIGIVTSEEYHPFVEYCTYEKAMLWLAQNDPFLHDKISKLSIVDFLKIRDYSYSSKQVFSSQRWACIGNAAIFADPFYSPGGEIIAYENTIITKMIELDRSNSLTEEKISYFNNYVISNNLDLTVSIQSAYPYMDKAQVMSLKYLWDLVIEWGIVYPQAFNRTYLDLEQSSQIAKVTHQLNGLVKRVEQLFSEWAEQNNNRFTFEFIDYRSIPLVQELYKRNTKTNQPFEKIIENCCHTMQHLEELAQVIFLLVLEDVMPEKLAIFRQPIWLNAWAISLQPEQWKAGELYQPTSQPRDLTNIMRQLRSVYNFS